MPAYERLLAGKRCLVLDDEFMIALDIQTILESAGASEVVCAADNAAAFSLLESGPPFDFAVLDVQLSVAATSQSVAARLVELGTPFIFLTGMRHDDVRRGGFPDTPLVEKPYQVPALLEAVARGLAARR